VVVQGKKGTRAGDSYKIFRLGEWKLLNLNASGDWREEKSGRRHNGSWGSAVRFS
jgi:hypothetical protein